MGASAVAAGGGGETGTVATVRAIAETALVKALGDDKAAVVVACSAGEVSEVEDCPPIDGAAAVDGAAGAVGFADAAETSGLTGSGATLVVDAGTTAVDAAAAAGSGAVPRASAAPAPDPQLQPLSKASRQSGGAIATLASATTAQPTAPISPARSATERTPLWRRLGRKSSPAVRPKVDRHSPMPRPARVDARDSMLGVHVTGWSAARLDAPEAGLILASNPLSRALSLSSSCGFGVPAGASTGAAGGA